MDLEIGLCNVLSNRRWHVCYLILAFNAFLYHWLPKITLDTFKQLSLRLRDCRHLPKFQSFDRVTQRFTEKRAKLAKENFFLISLVIYFMYTILFSIFIFFHFSLYFLTIFELPSTLDLRLLDTLSLIREKNRFVRPPVCQS